MNYEALDKYFNEVKSKIIKGFYTEKITSRILLQKLEVNRRGANVNSYINETLDKYDLIIEPEFEYEYVDNAIEIKDKKDQSNHIEHELDYRINSLKSANSKPVNVNPDDNFSKVITIMISKNYSQIPVMTDSRTVKGIITWKSIGNKLYLKKQEVKIKDVMQKAIIVEDEISLFDAIEQISKYDYVLVRDSKDNIIKGIVTSSDLSQQFKLLSEPFLLIGKSESLIKKIIKGIFTIEELNSAKNGNDPNRVINSIYDLTFGEYIRLFENKDYWKRLNIKFDRIEFVKILEAIRNIRNDIMHFDPSEKDEDIVNIIKSANELLENCINQKEAS